MIQRTISMPGTATGRTGIKLDQTTWNAVETLATFKGLTWRQWCEAIAHENHDATNVTAAIREAVVSELLRAVTLGHDRAHDIAVMEAHPLMKDSGVLDDRMLEEVLNAAHVQGESDFGGFSVLFGYDEHDQASIWIRNAMRDMPHFTFLIPSAKGTSK